MEEKKALKLISTLANPDRIKIVLMLLEGERSFAEIKNRFKGDYNSGLLLYNLRKLEKAGILVNRKRLDITSRPPKLSFYELTPIGKIIARHLALLKNELSQIAGENPVFLWIKFLYEDNFFNY